MTGDNRKPTWTRLGHGTLTEVWTDGERIKRPLGSWSAAVHRFLRHVERKDVWGVPRFVGIEGGSEILTRLPGRAVRRPWPEGVQSSKWMEQVGGWQRSVHVATSDFRLAGAAFVWGPDEPGAGEVVTHGDLGPWNMLERDGEFAGVIDWDLARFGSPLDDLAEAAFELGPLRENRDMLAGDTPQGAIRARVAALCRGYGGVSAGEVLRHVEPFYQRRIDEMSELASGGQEPFGALVEAGNVEALSEDLEHYRKHYKPGRL
jgi:hypothetical protein